eukprot:gene28522-31681_t
MIQGLKFLKRKRPLLGMKPLLRVVNSALQSQTGITVYPQEGATQKRRSEAAAEVIKASGNKASFEDEAAAGQPASAGNAADAGEGATHKRCRSGDEVAAEVNKASGNEASSENEDAAGQPVSASGVNIAGGFADVEGGFAELEQGFSRLREERAELKKAWDKLDAEKKRVKGEATRFARSMNVCENVPTAALVILDDGDV